MSTVEEIERAIRRLEPDDLARFRVWFDAFEGERLDRAIEQSSAADAIDRLAEQALREFATGQTREL